MITRLFWLETLFYLARVRHVLCFFLTAHACTSIPKCDLTHSKLCTQKLAGIAGTHDAVVRTQLNSLGLPLLTWQLTYLLQHPIHYNSQLLRRLVMILLKILQGAVDKDSYRRVEGD